MKNNGNHRFFTQIVLSTVYSAVLSCLVLLFTVTNLGLLSGYLEKTGRTDHLLVRFMKLGAVTTVAFVILGILIFSAAFLILQLGTLRYIERISEAVTNIADGDLNTQVEVRGDDEFSAMAASLNRMEAELRELMEKERESERTKNELITNVAHDLRTPLTSILGYLDLLSRGITTDPDTQKKYIDIAYTKARRLEKLIEDLFGFTKMTYGKLAMKIGPVDIVKLLGQLLEEFYPSFAGHDLTYELFSNVPAKTITADANLLARLFDNLINNAIKYGSEGKKVLVRIDAGEETVTVSVTNYGYVIPKEELPLLFHKFYRVEQSRSSNTGGTGLGLAISKSIVEMHGGTISVDSGPDGTVFTVVLKAMIQK